MALLHKSLQKHGFSVGALHGDMDQSARTAALDQFRKGEMPLLVASDVAARGLDIPAVSHVFNFDVPHHADDYVHRIGRTGRAGRAGTAISIVGPLDHKSIAAIEKLIGQTIPRMDIDLESHAGVAAASGEETEQPRKSRGRSETRDGARHAGGKSRGGRKPRREREPRRSGSNRQSEPKTHAPRNPAPVAAFTPPVAPQPSRTPSIGREPAPHSRELVLGARRSLALAGISVAPRSRQSLTEFNLRPGVICRLGECIGPASDPRIPAAYSRSDLARPALNERFALRATDPAFFPACVEAALLAPLRDLTRLDRAARCAAASAALAHSLKS